MWAQLKPTYKTNLQIYCFELKNKRMFNQARHISFRQVCLQYHSSGHSVDFSYLCVNGLTAAWEPLVQNTPAQSCTQPQT